MRVVVCQEVCQAVDQVASQELADQVLHMMTDQLLRRSIKLRWMGNIMGRSLHFELCHRGFQAYDRLLRFCVSFITTTLSTLEKSGVAHLCMAV